MSSSSLKRELLDTRRTLGWMDTVLANITDAVCVVDENFKIVFANDAFADMFGKKRIFLLGYSLDQVADLSNDTSTLAERLQSESNGVNNAEALSGDYDYTSNDSIAAVRVTAQSIPNLKQAVFLMHDITKERALERMRNEFISLASHQLRTPISTIMLYSQLLQGSFEDELDKDQQLYINNIVTMTRHMNVLVDNLLDVSRLSNKRKLQPRKLSLSKTIQDILTDLKPQLSEKQLELDLDVPEKLPEIVSSPVQVREIFSNLIVNGIQYSEPSGTISVAVRHEDDRLVARVQDEGIGIPKSSHTKVFQPFYRSPNAKTHFGNGTGLGLYVVHRMVQELSGRIWFESEPGQGTTFFVALPLDCREGGAVSKNKVIAAKA